MVEILDRADYVHIKGKEGNKTDLKVQMQEIKDEEKETKFLNCGADINIPVGKVYSSPKLKGTNGILHIKETFLNGLRFIDLEITFKDGYIDKYVPKSIYYQVFSQWGKPPLLRLSLA